ncbi:MAG: DSD1 family PLP-dependent enzyme, partial [SAR202 cluster bacterium]|nr:DSD1 family PLP-dependent enzyme [SAR202 cluster bacterium]
LHDDHMTLYSEEAIPLQVGDTYTLIPGYQDGVVNRWDQIIGIRNGVVEGVWAIPGRGCFY